MTTSREINLMGTLQPNEGCHARLRAILLELAANVKENEEGCLSYHVWEFQPRYGLQSFVLMEKWVSSEAFENHHNQPYLIQANEIIEREDLLYMPEEDRYLRFVGGWTSR